MDTAFQIKLKAAQKLIDNIRNPGFKPEKLAVGGFWQDVPFPFVGQNSQSCFAPTATDASKFEFMGRSSFKTFQEKLTAYLCSRAISLNVQGTIGEGKSHFVAAAVSSLLHEGRRVFFVPDCESLLRDAVEYLRLYTIRIIFSWM